MPPIHLLATFRSGCARIDGDERRLQVAPALESERVQCIAVDPHDPRRAFAGTWDAGLFRSLDGGSSWTPVGPGIAESRIVSLAISRCDSAGGRSVVYAGTEPANLYRSEDDGASWRSFPAIHALPSARSWFYPPRAGGQRVRSIAPHDSDPQLLVIGIEVGGVMCSRDAGETWEDHKRPSYEDSHALATHPLAPDRVYQGAAGGVAMSNDRGASWRTVDDGIDRRFVWALALDPEDPDLWYVSASRSPRHAHGGPGKAKAAIYRRRGAERWRDVGPGEARRNMPFALTTLRDRPGALLAGLDDGDLMLTDDAGESWRRLDLRVPGVRTLTEAPPA